MKKALANNKMLWYYVYWPRNSEDDDAGIRTKDLFKYIPQLLLLPVTSHTLLKTERRLLSPATSEKPGIPYIIPDLDFTKN